MNVYPFIEAEKQYSVDGQPGGNVARACELLKVSRSAYYARAAQQAAGGSARDRQDASWPSGSDTTTPRPKAATGHRGSTSTFWTKATGTAGSGSPG